MEMRSYLYSNILNMTVLNALFLFEKYKRIARHLWRSRVQIFWWNKHLELHHFLLWSKAVLSSGGDLREDFLGLKMDLSSALLIDLTAAVIRAVISAEFIEKIEWILIVLGKETLAPVTQINKKPSHDRTCTSWSGHTTGTVVLVSQPLGLWSRLKFVEHMLDEFLCLSRPLIGEGCNINQFTKRKPFVVPFRKISDCGSAQKQLMKLKIHRMESTLRLPINISVYVLTLLWVPPLLLPFKPANLNGSSSPLPIKVALA